jgi:STE24 endopeptidase
MTLARGPASAAVVVSSLVFLVLAVVLVPWDWVPGGELVPAEPHEVFTTEQIARAEEYASVRRWLGWASYFVSLAVAAVLGFTPLGARLVRRLADGWRWWLAVPVAVLMLMAIGRVATLPFSIAIRERNLDYGLTEQAWAAWGVDYAKSLLVGWVLTSLVVLVTVGAARWSPRYWFAWGGALAAGLVVAGSFLYPVVVEPVFNKFTPMVDGELRSSVLTLAEEQGVEVDDVLVADASRRTTTLNAYVSGFGGTRRVVVYDNLVDEMPADQASVVIAHELAHARHSDVVVGTALGAVGAVLGVALLALALDTRLLRRRADVRGPGDPAAVPLLLALAAAAGLLASPVQSTISRAVEVRADRDALAATAQADTFVDMQRRLAVASLSDPTPPGWSQFWFGSHPTVLQRAGLPRSLQAADKEGAP